MSTAIITPVPTPSYPLDASLQTHKNTFSDQQDTSVQIYKNTLAILVILSKLQDSLEQQFKTNKQLATMLQASEINLNLSSYENKLKAADITYHAAITRAAVGIVAGMVGMGGSIAGGVLSASPGTVDMGRQMSHGLQSFGEFMKSATDAAMASEDRKAQQTSAFADYQSKLADQSQAQTKSALDDAKQLLQDLLRIQQAFIDLLNQISSAVKVA